jgi:alpha-D-ribose 1-methylphosphonate 5-triphosphate synthase subunit PhnL
MPELKLSIQGLTKRFVLHIRGGLTVEALNDVWLDVERGQFIGLVGPSGLARAPCSRASTVLTCRTRRRLCALRRGHRRPRPGRRARHSGAPAGGFGYVSQFLRVIPRVTVERTVAAPLVTRGSSTRQR